MADDRTALSASVLRKRFEAGSLSPVTVTEAVLDRIVLLNESLTAFCLADGGAALQAAKQSEARWRRGEPLRLAAAAAIGDPVSARR